MHATILHRGIVSDTAENLFGYAAWPSVCRSDNGELLAVYSGNRLSHICPFGKVLLRRSCDDGQTWSTCEIVIDTPLDDRDAGITLLPNGRLLVTTFNNTRTDQLRWAEDAQRNTPDMKALIQAHCRCITDEQETKWYGALAALSDDDGFTWSKPFHTPVSTPHGVTVHKGKVLYAGTPAPGTPVEPDTPILVYESATGRDFKLLAKIPRCKELTACGHYEPNLLSVGDRLILAVRHDGEGVFTVSAAVSDDNGHTWSRLKPTGAVGSPPHMLLHSSGRVIMTYGRRTPPYGIEALISEDRGATWSDPLPLWQEGTDPDLGYPCSVELDNGDIFTLYYGKQDSTRCKILSTTWALRAGEACTTTCTAGTACTTAGTACTTTCTPSAL